MRQSGTSALANVEVSQLFSREKEELIRRKTEEESIYYAGVSELTGTWRIVNRYPNYICNQIERGKVISD